MEDQDRETRPDEDVEGHSNHGVHHEPSLDNNLGNNLGREDDDDVEGHSNHGVNLEPSLDNNLGNNLGREDDDDVEGHMNLNRSNLGQNQA
ncbi:MAG TPA: hypothetical protein VKB10_06985 [Gaiellaceae bacterium]|nr:hypothetical protein [Gaiellaceae bacterium]